jgi:hypothetical protein
LVRSIVRDGVAPTGRRVAQVVARRLRYQLRRWRENGLLS